MSLAARKARFGELASRFPCGRPTPLIAAHRADPAVLERLRIAAALYLARCLPDASAVSAALLANETALLAETERQWDAIPNITPNGMVVPKRELNLEYNLFVAAFAALVASLGIDDLIEAWVHPPNLRVKEGAPNAQKLNRPYASERRHTEAWIEMNTARCVSVFVPLLGDTARNSVRFFAPADDFDEKWLKPLPSYEDGESISRRYQEVEVGYDKGFVYLADAATMHQSERQAGAGPRASIDVNFLLRTKGAASVGADRTSQADLCATGQTRFFTFLDSMGQQVDTLGGKRHPTDRRRLVDLTQPAPAARRPVRQQPLRNGWVRSVSPRRT